MELSSVERVILGRYHEKTRIAGGPRKGYVLRQQAIRYRQAAHPDLDFTAGLADLVAKGLLKVSEDERFYFLTEAGVELLQRWPGAR